MHAEKILVPVDFSGETELNDAEMRFATVLAQQSGASLLILHVHSPGVAYREPGEPDGPLPEELASLRKRLEAIVPPNPQVECAHWLVSGDPAHEIVHLAEQEHVDLIVMGTHGRTGLKRLLMGSVAEAVVRHASCPVFTLKQPAAAMAIS